ncbi:hypothetical protein A2678_03360 [Candidatus Kaiserbacteria bacterium RIFCSPHIGHO2_01_FULL_53_31]|uniref:Yeast cell wall synthesis Kre9/Knh1-like N-terminal domain-containing protein n=1 Tax=Candidatus Kaiserbacteria bacterium RIFCSPHIGHO2_01_FULL_53_31 TaxID=1798481 RepID=A0A1F6CH46_9BACT|nr:MAG: hypothetical protein A2678_03360 [Candidatus Kaiserbacteria bacterium RIFCSPHIGHO2_01_FULL_53_31]
MISRKIILIIVSLILLAGIGFYFYGLPPIRYWTKTPTNFEECKGATRGFIIKTLPAQCEFRGQNFVDQSQQGQGASFVPEQDRIQVSSPNGGEKLEVGKTYDVRWTNYSGKEPLTIALQATTPSNQVSVKIVASSVPAASTGTYKWIVTSESAENRYRIEVYPAGGRELVGRSKDFFTISGEE